jgi:hypothetical protein
LNAAAAMHAARLPRLQIATIVIARADQRRWEVVGTSFLLVARE